MIGDWPEYRKLKKIVPSFGLYIRHAKYVRMNEVEFSTKEKDGRPAMVFVDVTKTKTDKSLN